MQRDRETRRPEAARSGSPTSPSAEERPGALPDDGADSPAGAPPPRSNGTGGAPLSSFGVNAAAVEDIKQLYEVDPSSVDRQWEGLFEQAQPVHARPRPGEPSVEGEIAPALAELHAAVLRLIHSFRARGHRVARTDPLGASPRYFPELDPAHYGFSEHDFERRVIAGDLPGGSIQTLRQILDRLTSTYCTSIGFEFTHIQDPGRKSWMRRRIETTGEQIPLSAADRFRVLEKLSAAELFERFLHTKFIGQKRFSLEGAESLIPLLDTLVEEGADHEVREFVLGMAHRGRLNVLSNILGKSLESIFSEFEDAAVLEQPYGSGDVKYHKGFSSDRETLSGRRVHLSLTSNPSHLEAVDPVVEGRAKAKQMRAADLVGRSVMPIVIHGEAAFAGQGMVAETLNLARLAGYSTGGTIHVVVNNQIGFTATPTESYSTLYATDVAKMIQVPVVHVNGDDPEAVVYVARLAVDYRQRFGEDFVIDLVCYRRHGHNEGDEPKFTQPLLYEKIKRMTPVRRLYTEQLISMGALDDENAKGIEADLNGQLTHALQSIKTRPPEPDEPYEPRGPWSGFARMHTGEDPDTGVEADRLGMVAEALGTVPSDFNLHPKLADLLERRRKAITENAPIDWALGEALAFGTLVAEGTPVRLSGQDSTRGTFSQRHCALVDQRTGVEYIPLQHLHESQARFDAYDSALSEAGVLGFEYGYSLADPSSLVLWEAQFGDFVNGAQVIIDQFIASAHVKWQRMSGLVMLLPHGYEGQGPEHSSARLERFLQLCAEDNMQVVNATTPAQYFHLLRRQMLRRWRAPLVVFTPKSLLRNPRATSLPDELVRGRFQRVIDDDHTAPRPDRVKRVLLCTGKVYYELLDWRDKRVERVGPDAAGDVAIVRVEQLYPWPAVEVAAAVRRYLQAETVFWVQEEPSNMGAWSFVRERVGDVLRPEQRLGYAGRGEAASPAGGSARVHRERQGALLDAAFAGLG